MHLEQLARYLERPAEAARWLRELGIKNAERAHSNLVAMVKAGLTLDLLASICDQLAQHLPPLSDPDMALNNLERFLLAARNPIALGALFERDREALPILLQIFSSSQHFSDLLTIDPETYDLLRITEGQPVARDVLVNEICSEVAALSDERLVLAALRRYKRRETLRIAYGDIVRSQRVDVVTRQTSFLADALCEAALQHAIKTVTESRGRPRRPDGQEASMVVLALGKLGGNELNYSSDIDLIFLYDADGKTDGQKSVTNGEFFDRVARLFLKLLTEPTPLGIVYRVDLRLRPDGSRGPMVVSRDSALHYYDLSGRTWERQAFVKARPCAGNLTLGREFLKELEPWMYRRYLSRADISGIRALKRRIEQRAQVEGGGISNVKTGQGGIRDIEFVIQFLQLLNGADLPEIRTSNTLQAIQHLERVGCLSMQERQLLEKNYEFLRRIEHRLQIMFDLQTHTLPWGDDEEMRKLAIRLGYADSVQQPALAAFLQEYTSATSINRKILDHLLHDAFPGDDQAAPEVDLVLDPDPSPETIQAVLGKYRFRDVSEANRNLEALATEKIRFLNTRRCRHFLAAISPKLLAAIADTPDPDATLVNLSVVSDSLGGKGVLWELFSFNEPSLHLMIRICASSSYLTSILTSSPGMIDELLDSLLLDRLPNLASLDATLTELCRNAEDIDPIIHSFKVSQHLSVGVRDILGKDHIQSTHAALSDIAETCLKHIILREYQKLTEKYGIPTISRSAGDIDALPSEREGQPCELILLALGKLGGREPNYHSDLDVVFLYDEEGMTQPIRGRKTTTTTNQHFFSQLAQRIMKLVTHPGPFGKLYDMDPRLRPTGKSGALACSLAELQRYFVEGHGALWERQALCKARLIYGSPQARERAEQVIRRAILEPAWQPENAREIYRMRHRLEETASKHNLKRGPGGTVDVEFAVQMLQLKNAARHPEVIIPNTLDAITALSTIGALSGNDACFLTESYRFLRSLESRLRLMNTTARHDLPSDPLEQRKLAYLFEDLSPEELMATSKHYMTENRKRYDLIFGRAERAS